MKKKILYIDSSLSHNIFHAKNRKKGLSATVGIWKSFSFPYLLIRRHNVYLSRAGESTDLAWLPYSGATKKGYEVQNSKCLIKNEIIFCKLTGSGTSLADVQNLANFS